MLSSFKNSPSLNKVRSKVFTKSNALVVVGGVLALALTTTLCFVNEIRKHKNSKVPINFKKINKSKIPPIKEKRKNILKDRFKPALKDEQIPKNIDYIVIGSGIGGLSCASALSKCGYKVLVLEQHDRLGGCMHVYGKKYNWDVGIHYIGKASKYTKWLNVLSSSPIEFVSQGNKDNNFTYDEYVIGTLDSKLKTVIKARGNNTRIPDLKKLFNSKKDILALNKFEKIKSKSQMVTLFLFICRFLSYYPAKVIHFICKIIFNSVWNKSTYDILNNVFKHNQLLSICVSANFGDLGLYMKNTSFNMFCGLYDHYVKQGGYYIKGGPSTIVKNLIKTIEEYGGRCLGNAIVKNLLYDKNISQINGVNIISRVNKQEYGIYCKYGVISTIGFRNTYTKLIPICDKSYNDIPIPNWFRSNAIKLLNSLKPSAQHFQVFIGMNKSQKELQLPSYNIWHLGFTDENIKNNSYDYDKLISSFHNDPLNGPLFGFIGFPSAKDPTYNNERPNKSTCVIVTEIPYNYFKKYSHLPVDLRGEEYNNLKKQIGQRLINQLLFKQFPQCKNAIAHVKYGTPLTANYYLGSSIGESYGLDNHMDRFFDFNISRCLNPKQCINGLYIGGQDAVSCGFGGAFHGGLLAAEAVLGGYHNLSSLFAGRTLISDLNKLNKLNCKY